MKMTKLSSGKYRIRMMEKGQSYSIVLPYKPTEKEAYKLLRQKIDNPTGKYDTWTFEKAMNNYMDQKCNVLSPSTKRGYSSISKSLPTWFINLMIKDIDQIEVQKLINEMAKERTPKTMRNVHGFVSAVLSTFNPTMVLHTTLPQNVRNEPYIPTEDDVKRLLEYCKDTEYFVPIYLASLGLRRGEICALTLEDLSEDNVLTINKDMVQNENSEYVIKSAPKTDSSNRSIILPPQLADRIRKQGYVYKYNPNAIDNYLRRNLPKLGIEIFSLHKLRHFFASFCHSKGYSEQTIQDLGGWATPNIMKSVYRHAMKKDEARINVSKDMGLLFMENP